MDNKICIYAICKNEIQFVDAWLASMSEADYVVVLDTGSTDGTYEFLKNDPRVYRVEQKIINPWRFDVARNESMKLVPDEANILVCTDLDELFIEGWAWSLREQWIEGQYRRAYYLYAWDHAADGSPQLVFEYDKVHTRDYHWAFPVHEVLQRNDGYLYPEDEEHSLHWNKDTILLHHYQDVNKPRNSYFPLLKLRLEENPNEPYSHYLLAREYGNMEQYENAIIEFQKTINMPIEYQNGDILKACYGYLGDCYGVIGEYQSAIQAYQKWIDLDPTYAEPYYWMAEIYLHLGMYQKARDITLKGLETAQRHFSWLERQEAWREKPWDILAIATYYTGDYDMGIQASRQALNYYPEDTRLLRNYISLLEKRFLE